MPAKQPARIPEPEMARALERYVAWLMRGREKPLTPATAKGYVGRTRRFLRHLNTLSPTVAQARDYIAWFRVDAERARGGGPQSRSSARQTAYAVAAWLEYRSGHAVGGKALGAPPLPKPATPDFLSMEEARKLLEAIDNRRDYALISLLLYSGVRAAEAAALKVKHLDAERSLLVVPPRGVDGRAGAKGEKGREVVLHGRAVDALKTYLRHRPEGEGPDTPLLASALTHGHMWPESVSDIVRKWTKRAVGRQVGAHAMRHTFGVHAADDADGKAPMPIRRLQEQLGHADVKTTLRYVHAAKGGLVESYRRAVPEF